MKRFLFAVCLSVLVSAFIYLKPVYAVGEGNVDGGGGSMGQGTSSNKWTPGQEGVRVSIVRAEDHEVVSIPIDLTNRSPSDIRIHFDRVSKLSYSKGQAIEPSSSPYTFIRPAQALPKIISSKSLGQASIEEIKAYFTDEQVIRGIAGQTGMDFDVLINGEYKLLIEPVSYVTFQNVRVAMTATEAALYDEYTGGALRAVLPTVAFQNLPLAMFLEVGDLGYPAWSGPETGIRTNHEIITALGLGVVRFREREPEEPDVTTYDYEYRVNTEVITSVIVNGGQSDPDHPVSVTFRMNGRSYRVDNVYYPEGDSQLAWIRWTTPGTPQTMTIDVSVSGGGTTQGTIRIRVTDLNQNPPPNPVADDRNDGFHIPETPEGNNVTRREWGIWRPWWQEYWVWIPDWDYCDHGEDDGHWVDNGWWEDHGWWEFDQDRYEAGLRSVMSIFPDGRNPTANGRSIKSGYGINQTVNAYVNTNQSSAVTPVQTVVSYFPEFQYRTYRRFLECMQDGYPARFEFQQNRYSTYRSRTHFTPVWYPDGTYAVYTNGFDAWTPSGMLSFSGKDVLTIRGNLWQDWHAAPLKPN